MKEPTIITKRPKWTLTPSFCRPYGAQPKNGGAHPGLTSWATLFRLCRGSLVCIASLIIANATCVPSGVPTSDLTLVASTATPTTFEGTSVVLSAQVMGGTPPYLFRWDQNAGPVDVELEDVESPTLTTRVLIVPGRYVFRVVVTDQESFHVTDFVAVTVASTIEAEAPALILINEPTQLTATVEAGIGEVAFQWEILGGSGRLSDSTVANPLLTTEEPETLEVRLTATASLDSSSPSVTTRTFEIVAVDDLRPQVVIETDFGDVTLELNGEAAPLHTANFLLYVDDGFFDGLLFHRNACSSNAATGECEPFVLQGGGYRRVGDELVLEEATRDPVVSEADNGLSNSEIDSVALALRPGGPNTGTTQFFINLADNSFLDDQQFTVFGKIIGDRGPLEAIVATDRTESSIITGEESLPVDDIVIRRIRRATP